MTREVERFRARSDDGAFETIIVVREELHDARTFDKPDAAPIAGLKSAKTVEGLHCNFIGEGVFEVLHPLRDGLRVRRVP